MQKHNFQGGWFNNLCNEIQDCAALKNCTVVVLFFCCFFISSFLQPVCVCVMWCTAILQVGGSCHKCRSCFIFRYCLDSTFFFLQTGSLRRSLLWSLLSAAVLKGFLWGMGSPPITVTVCQCVFISVVVLILGVSTCKKRLWFIFNWLPLTEVSIWIYSTWVEWISSCSGQFLSLLFTSGYNSYCYITVRPPSNKNTPAPGLLVVNRELSPHGSQHLYKFTTTEKSHDQNALDSRVKCFSFIQNLILEESFNRGKKVFS